MEVNRKHFPKILQDNDEIFIQYLIAVIESVDELSSLEITKLSEGIKFRIAPSLPKYNNMLIEEILKFHNMFNIHINISKSIKTSSVITFEININ